MQGMRGTIPRHGSIEIHYDSCHNLGMTFPADEAKPTLIVRRPYKSFVIEVQVYKQVTGEYYPFAYIEQSAKDSLVKKRFIVSGSDWGTQKSAVEQAINEGQQRIDGGFDPDSFD